MAGDGEVFVPCCCAQRLQSAVNCATRCLGLSGMDIHTVCDFIMLTFRSYRTNGTTVFFNKTVEKRMLLLSNGNDRGTLRFQTIQQANSMATRVSLRLFWSSTNVSVFSPVSNRSIANEIIMFCNPSDSVRKTSTVERCVQWSNRSIKMERKRNGTLTL